MPVSAASHWLAVWAPITAWTCSPGFRYWAAELRMVSRSCHGFSLVVMNGAPHGKRHPCVDS